MRNKTIALAGAGILAASALALGGAALASADETGSTGSTSSGTGGTYGQLGEGAGGGPDLKGNGNTDPSRPTRSDEKLLTGDIAAKVTAAAKAKEPTATIERVETDSDGVYEAHMVRADGTHVTVQVDASFTVTAVQEGGPGGSGRPGGSGGPGSRSGDRDADGAEGQQGGSTTTPESTATPSATT